MFYCFLGVSIVIGIFMSSIEKITSKRRRIYGFDRTDSMAMMAEEKVWNSTVATLTLMALGTSGPEICISVVDIVMKNFQGGSIGAGTVIGSAAYNIFLITALCMLSLKRNETRRIKRFRVFLVTGIFSVFAYMWLFIILRVFSANVIELWEAILTFSFFPLLVFCAYATGKWWWTIRPLRIHKIIGTETRKELAEKTFFKDGTLNRESLLIFIKELVKYGISLEDAALLAAVKLIDSQSHSPAWYKMGGVRVMSSGKRLRTTLDSRLEEVYNILRQVSADVDVPPRVSLTVDLNLSAIIEFDVVTVGVREEVGEFPVTIIRRGNLNFEVAIRVQTVDGTAIKNEDYVPIDEVVLFPPGEEEAQSERENLVHLFALWKYIASDYLFFYFFNLIAPSAFFVIVKIINEQKVEPTEEFFLRLSRPTTTDMEQGDMRVHIGRIGIMEVKIEHDELPGVVTFEKVGAIVKESEGEVNVNVERVKGSDGRVSVKWKTQEVTAKEGKDFVGGEGILVFNPGDRKRVITVKILNEMSEDKDVRFDIHLSNPTGGAAVGHNSRIAITITDDQDILRIIDHLMIGISMDMDVFKAQRADWCQRIKDAMLVNGGDVKSATNFDYFLHFCSFFWKVLFAFIPPPSFLGGWCCFFVSLFFIGVMTTIVVDIAYLFGCLVGLEDTMTAITLVAFGASVPDIIACNIALKGTKYADDAIGFINGSNSVLVFLGLGLPWTCACIYNTVQGENVEVRVQGVDFSSLLFSISVALTLAIFILRRNLAVCGYAEIGGPPIPRYCTAIILLLLWILYVTLSYLQMNGIITVDFFEHGSISE